MAEAFGIVTAALGLLKQSLNLVQGLQQKYQDGKKVHEKCNELEELMNHVQSNLENLEKYKLERLTVNQVGDLKTMIKCLKCVQTELEKTQKQARPSEKLWIVGELRKCMRGKEVVKK